MVTAIGLAMDVVGAVALTLGLFGEVRGLYPGMSVKTPEDVSHDTGFAVVGLTLLPTGFLLQGLPSFGFEIDCSAEANRLAAGITILAATVFAWLAYGGLYIARMEHEIAKLKRDPNFGPYRAIRRPRGLRFWNYEAY